MIQIDIDMPKRCEECPFCLDLDCILYGRVTNEYYVTTYEQYIHCPLKDVADINVGDTISRQSAIAVADYTDYAGLPVEDVKKVTDEVVKGLKQLPSSQSLAEEDYMELRHRFGTQVESVVRDMVSGKENRWMI